MTEIDPITAEVLGGAVHDLRGPANRLRTMAQLLKSSAAGLDEDALRLLGYVEASAAAVGSVAEGLRSYVEICARPLHCGRVDLALAVESARAAIRSEFAAAGGTVTAPGLPAVEADGFLVEWLLRELLTNAIRFRGPDPPRIRISASGDGPAGWMVCVTDNGRGIDSAMAERVFGPFRKLADGPGAGLGLTICRRIVEMHGGRMWLEAGSKGADFRFTLSAAVEAG